MISALDYDRKWVVRLSFGLSERLNQKMKNRIKQNLNTDCYSRIEKAGPFDYCCSHQSVEPPSCVSLFLSELTVDILNTFCHGFMVKCVKLMMSKVKLKLKC